MNGVLSISSALSFVGETALMVYFFKDLPNRGKMKAANYMAIVTAIPMIYVIYMSGVPFLSPEPIALMGFREQLLRLALRMASTCLYLYAFKEISSVNLLYWAGFSTALHNAFTCMRWCIFVFFNIDSLSDEPIAASVTILLLEAAIYYIVCKEIKVKELTEIGGTRIIELLFNTALYLIIKLSIKNTPLGTNTSAIWLTITAIFGLSFSLIALERNQQLREQQVKLAVETTELKYEISNAMRAQRSDQNLKRLYHDMKNHLLAIQSMAGDKKELNDYLGELLPQLDDYGNRLNTGSAIIDALLGDKRERAAGVDVRLHVQLDLTPLSFMNNAELVSIFGNAVDNAVEAARECSDPNERCVYIKGRRVHDMFFLSFENHYAGERSRQAGRFRTGKADRELHGIGLGSIEKAVRKYSGEVHAEHDNEKRFFTLNIMLPLPEEGE